MITFIGKQRKHPIYRMISGIMAFTFIFSVVIPPSNVFAQSIPTTIFNLPVPGAMVPLTSGFTPVMVNGITIYPDDPFKFDFLVGRGDNQMEGEEFKNEAQKLIKYFLASLTVPEEELWVNLSPYEEDRIIPDSLSKTEMGRDLLAQDYMLKQLTASLMYPENELGERFWNRIRQKVQAEYGINDIPVDTFNKVWIVPQEATVYESQSTAIVIDSYLKVMLDSDYEAMQNSQNVGNAHVRSVQGNNSKELSEQAIKEIIIPAIEKEVNEGETFANLRQIYNSMILATWYKKNLKESLLGQVYVDQKKMSGIDTVNSNMKDQIYQQYLKAFEVGVYDYIREEYDPFTQEIVPRKYFAGGMGPVTAVVSSPIGNREAVREALRRTRRLVAFTAELHPSAVSSPASSKGDAGLPKLAPVPASISVVNNASATPANVTTPDLRDAVLILEKDNPAASIAKRGRQLLDLRDSSSPVDEARKVPFPPPPSLRIATTEATIVEVPDGTTKDGEAKFARTIRFDLSLGFKNKMYDGFYVVPAGTSSGEDERKPSSVEDAVENLKAISAKVKASDINFSADNALVRIADIMLEMDEELRAQFEGDEKDFIGLGAQATLAYQMAFWMAAAASRGVAPYQYLRVVAPGLILSEEAALKSVKTRGLFNVTNGGEHANNDLDLQEFMVLPQGKDYADGIKMAKAIDHELGLIYKALGLRADVDDQGMGTLRGKEGGYSIPDLTKAKLAEILENADLSAHLAVLNNLPLEEMAKKEDVGIHSFLFAVLEAAIKNAGYVVDHDKTGAVGSVQLASDGAVSELTIKLDDKGDFTKSLDRVLVKQGDPDWFGDDAGEDYFRLKAGGTIFESKLKERVRDGEFLYMLEGEIYTSAELSDFWVAIAKEYPIGSLEDVKDENDWEGLIDLIVKLRGKNVTIVVDDSTVTQEGRLNLFIEKLEAAGLIDSKTGKVYDDVKLAILIKVNQNGFLMTGRTSKGIGEKKGYAGTLEVMQLAKDVGIESDVSHRSKEAGPEHGQGAIGQLAAAANVLGLKAGDPVSEARFNMHNALAEAEQAMAASSSPVSWSRYVVIEVLGEYGDDDKLFNIRDQNDDKLDKFPDQTIQDSEHKVEITLAHVPGLDVSVKIDSPVEGDTAPGETISIQVSYSSKFATIRQLKAVVFANKFLESHETEAGDSSPVLGADDKEKVIAIIKRIGTAGPDEKN